MRLPMRLLILQSGRYMLALQTGEASSREPRVRLSILQLPRHKQDQTNGDTGQDREDVRCLLQWPS